MTRDGLPHSEIPGSRVVCTSPRLLAAYHVLHRLHVPRHPPYALNSFIKSRCILKRVSYAVDQLSKSVLCGADPDSNRDNLLSVLCGADPEANRDNLLSVLCGADRDRTGNLLRARQALSQTELQPRRQLSQSINPVRPIVRRNLVKDPSSPITLRSPIVPERRLVGLGRLELPTSRLSGVRSNHLSYKPISRTKKKGLPTFPI